MLVVGGCAAGRRRDVRLAGAADAAGAGGGATRFSGAVSGRLAAAHSGAAGEPFIARRRPELALLSTMQGRGFAGDYQAARHAAEREQRRQLPQK